MDSNSKGDTVVTDVKPMQLKKEVQQTTSSSQKDAGILNWALYDQLAQIKQEFFKITWTDPHELKAYTQIVVGATFIFGIGIFCADLLIHSALSGLTSFIHLIGG